jgi:hypothetical protein
VGQIKRDREVELVHRGAQYARAVQKYFRKVHQYPTSIEQLENTNNIRFLRRRYKDPVTGQDFKLLHMGDVQIQPSSGSNGGTNLGTSASDLAANTQQAGAGPITSLGGTPVAGNQGAGPILGVASTSKKQSILEFNGKDHYNDWQFIYMTSLDRGGLIRGPYNGQSLLPTVNPGGLPGGPGGPGGAPVPNPGPQPQPQNPR